MYILDLGCMFVYKYTDMQFNTVYRKIHKA